MEGKRDIPHVCQKCKDFMFPPYGNLHIFSDNKCTKIIEVCRECKIKN